MQLINALPCFWKINILKVRGGSIDFCVYDNDVIKSSQPYVINKLNSNELYIIQHVKISWNLLHKKTQLDWKNICIMPRIVATDTATAMSWYEILNYYYI